MKQKFLCPACKITLSFDPETIDRVKCPKCSYEGHASQFEDPHKTGGLDSLNKNKLYRPLKLVFRDTDSRWLGSNKEFALQRGPNTLGRKHPNSSASIQFPVEDSFMSKNHANIDVVMKSDSTFEHRLSDSGSTNGTFHNGERLDKGDIVRLKPNDTIRLGHTTFKFITE
jgi:hypothetical protein